MNKAFEYLMNSDEDEKLVFSSDINSLVLDLYFNKYWNGNSTTFEKSGLNLVKIVNDLNPQTVLDVGCGNNNFKGLIDNLVGIDPFNRKADIAKTLIQYYHENPTTQHDVVLCLDSINFGRRPTILHHFDVVDKITNTGGHQFWRVNPNPIECEEFPPINLIDFFEWNEEFIKELASFNGYEIKELCEETNNLGEKRLFFCFYKY